MYRILVSFLLGLGLVLIGKSSYGLEDSQFFFESWFCSFLLPMWSIFSIGLWHDVGGLFFYDSKSEQPLWIRSIVFILWMSTIFTYVVWVHISLQVVHMLIMVLILGIPLRELLVSNLTKYRPTKEHLVTVLIWFISSYPVYWILTILWILFRVFIFDMTTNGVVYYIQ